MYFCVKQVKMGAGVSKMDKDKVKKALSDGNEGLISLLTEISAQSFATVEMDASEVGASHGETTIDHVWKRKLANAIRDTKPAASASGRLAFRANSGDSTLTPPFLSFASFEWEMLSIIMLARTSGSMRSTSTA